MNDLKEGITVDLCVKLKDENMVIINMGMILVHRAESDDVISHTFCEVGRYDSKDGYSFLGDVFDDAM